MPAFISAFSCHNATEDYCMPGGEQEYISNTGQRLSRVYTLNQMSR